MSISSSNSKKKSSRLGVHFIGIGGIGMSGLARYFLAHGWAVSGSDAAVGIMTQELIKDGVEVKIGHKKGNIPASARLVIYNRAIPADNPELVAAEKTARATGAGGDKGMVVLPYSKALGRSRRTIRQSPLPARTARARRPRSPDSRSYARD